MKRTGPIDPLARRLREARLAAGWKQSELAARLEISQAAVSQYERGNTRAVGRETLARACELLGVDAPAASPAPPSADAPETLKFCEHADCISNVPYEGRRGAIVRPRMTSAPVGEPTFCPECGEILMDHCRDEACGARVREGSFCMDCGLPYVKVERIQAPSVDRDAVLERTSLRVVRSA